MSEDKGLEAMIDRADYPPASFLDIKHGEQWVVWYLGAVVPLAYGEGRVTELYYAYNDDEGCDEPMGAFTQLLDGSEEFHRLENLKRARVDGGAIRY
jgi:hypothetical protein